MEGNVKFTALDDVTVITGDFGNWVLDLQIRLVSGGSFDAGYLAGKCRQSSTQNPYVFDKEATELEIKDYLNDEDSNLTLEEKEYLDTCLEFLEMGEFDYHAYAFRNNIGRFESYEAVPDCKKLVEWFSIICDAGDEICRRLKEQEETIENEIDTWILEAGGGSMRDALNVALTQRKQLIKYLEAFTERPDFGDINEIYIPAVLSFLTQYNDFGK